MEYSYSRLTTFDNCPLQYKFSYVLKEAKDFENSIEAFMGSRVHEALEELYKKQKLNTVMTLEEVLNIYKKNWNDKNNDNIKIIKKELNKKNYFDLGIKYLTNYYNRFKPFDSEYTVGLEMEIKLDLNNDGKYLLIGYIDRLSMKDNVYYIHDYKTSSILPTNEEINKNKQLALYAMAIKQMYQNVKKVILIWHYLAFDTDLIVEKEENDYELIRKQTIEKINAIENLENGNYLPKESTLCEWCAYASKCPMKKHNFKVKQFTLEEYNLDYGVKLVEKYSELEEKKNKIINEIKELDEKILEYSKVNKLKKIVSNNNSITIYETDNYSIPTKGTPKYEELKNIVKENYPELLCIDNYYLTKNLNIGLINDNVYNNIMKLVEKKQFFKIYFK